MLPEIFNPITASPSNSSKSRSAEQKAKYISLILVFTLMLILFGRDTIFLRSETPSGENKMSVLTSLLVVVLGTYITIWFNDKVSRSDYLADDSIEPS
jgi:preprotein translocase subunit SecY